MTQNVRIPLEPDPLTGVCVLVVTGNPATSPGVQAPVGSVALRRDGASGAAVYHKVGTAATAWEHAAGGVSGTITSPASGDLLTHNGTTWVNTKTHAGTHTFGGLIVGTDPGGTEPLRVGGTVRVGGLALVGGLLAQDAAEPQVKVEKTGASAGVGYLYRAAATWGLYDQSNNRFLVQQTLSDGTTTLPNLVTVYGLVSATAGNIALGSVGGVLRLQRNSASIVSVLTDGDDWGDLLARRMRFADGANADSAYLQRASDARLSLFGASADAGLWFRGSDTGDYFVGRGGTAYGFWRGGAWRIYTDADSVYLRPVSVSGNVHVTDGTSAWPVTTTTVSTGTPSGNAREGHLWVQYA